MKNKIPTRPVISELHEHNGKQFWLPNPPRYKELVDCVRVLGIKSKEDEDDMRIIKYRSLIGVVPSNDDHWSMINGVAGCLAKLNPGQLEAVKMMCAEFDLTFHNVGQLFDFLALAKGIRRKLIKKHGIKIQTDEGDE